MSTIETLRRQIAELAAAGRVDEALAAGEALDRALRAPSSDLSADPPPQAAPGWRRPVWAVVPGLIRDLPVLARILNRLLVLRAAGRLDVILVSTWHGHVSGRPELRAAFDQAGIRWVECEEPRPNPSGHNLHQMKAVHAGLRACPRDAFVLKLRTDKVDLAHPVMAGMIDNALTGRLDLEPAPPPGWPKVFGKRVAVAAGHLLKMFYLSDQVFFGLRDDLLKLLNFDLRYVELFGMPITEQWWFSYPFIDRFPIFQDVLKVQGVPLGNPPLPAEIVPALLGNDLFLDALATYLRILNAYFRIGFLPPGHPFYAQAPEALAAVTYGRWFLELGHPFGCNTDQKTHYFLNDCWIAPLIEGRPRLDRLGERVRAAFARTAPIAFHETFPDRAADLAALDRILRLFRES